MRIFPKEGMRMDTVHHIEDILRRELELYKQVCNLEEKKGEAIISRDGSLLEMLSHEQEAILTAILDLESERSTFLDAYRKEKKLDDLSREITLRDITCALNEDRANRIYQLGVDLKSLLYKIQALAETNEKLARDHIEVFTLLLKEIKGRLSLRTGYNKEAVENCAIENPLVINRTA